MACSIKLSSRNFLVKLAPLVMLMASISTDRALGQLSDEDIAALQQRAKTEGWTFSVGHNGATCRSLEKLCGGLPPEGPPPEGRPGGFVVRGGLPPAYNWCDYGVCTAVRDQGLCGSCWAFALNGAFEANIAIQDADLVDLSEQWLISCTDAGNCLGGWSDKAGNYSLCKGEYTDPCDGYGAVLESDFPYEGSEVYCGCPYPHPYCLDDWAFVDGSTPSVEAIKQAMLDYGPVKASVRASNPFHGYNGGVFNEHEDGEANHDIVLVGWDDTQGTEGVWILRNSWGTAWGEDLEGVSWDPDGDGEQENDGGYMRIEYECCNVGCYALYVDYAGRPPSLTFDYPDGKPEMLNPGEPTTFRVLVTGEYDGTPTPGSGDLHYRLNEGAWYSVDMTPTDPPNEYEATLPAADCFDRYDWYVSAQEATGGETFCDPEDAPTTSYSALVATGTAHIFIDDFEFPRGWEVYAGAETGNWERADPEEVISGGWLSQPEDDYSPDGTLEPIPKPL